MAPFSSWPRAAARSPRWLRSTAPTGIPVWRPDHGQQRQSVRHHRGGGASATAPFSSWPRAAARSPRWLRSTAPTVQYPFAGLIMDGSGNLYGTTGVAGASTSDGTVFEWPRAAARSPRWLRSTAPTGQAPGRPDHGQQRQPVRHDAEEAPTATARFSSWPTAAARSPRWLRSTAPTVQYPQAGLIMDSSGNLFGTTNWRRVHGDGTVFELAQAAARSPRWPRSTAPTVRARMPP